MFGISCACDISFIEKLRTVSIDKAKMETTELHNYYDKDAITTQFGDDAKDRYMEETDGRGAAYRGRDGAFYHRDRHTGDPVRATPADVEHYLGADTEEHG